MFSEVSDIVNTMKEKAMEAILPNGLPKEMKDEFLRLSHKMSPAQIAEVGKKFQECREKARKEYSERRKEKEQNRDLLAERMSARQ